MSRFGIRKRLKGALGMGKRSDEPVHTLTFVLPDGSEREVQAEHRYTLLMASETLPAPISTGRRAGGTCPDGGCALCRVEILDPTGLTPMSDDERATMNDAIAGTPHEGREREPAPPAKPNTRLGCWVRVEGSGGRVQVLELFDYDSVIGSGE